jgi:hypothetical protein
VQSHVLVQEPGKPDREWPLSPGETAEPLPSVRVSAAEAAGVVIEPSVRRITVCGRVLRGGERRLLRPGEVARVGDARIFASSREPGTATQARGLLLAALRGQEVRYGPGIDVLEGPEAGRLLPLREGVLGRGEHATLRLADPSLSRSHARIRVEGGRVLVEDLGSKNGTWLRGVAISSLRDLLPGDEARAGRTVFALALTTGAGTDPPAPPPEPQPARSTRLARAALAVAIGAAAAAAAIASS